MSDRIKITQSIQDIEKFKNDMVSVYQTVTVFVDFAKPNEPLPDILLNQMKSVKSIMDKYFN